MASLDLECHEAEGRDGISAELLKSMTSRGMKELFEMYLQAKRLRNQCHRSV